MNIEAELKRIIGSYKTEDDIIAAFHDEREVVWELHLRLCRLDCNITKKYFMDNYPFKDGEVDNFYHKDGKFNLKIKFQKGEHLFPFDSSKVIELFGLKNICGGWAGYYYGQYTMDQKLLPERYRQIIKGKLVT